MTNKLIVGNLFLALAVVLFLSVGLMYAHAAEITGTLTGGAATGGGTGGSLSGTVTGGGGGSLSGTVTGGGGGGSSSGGGGGGGGGSSSGGGGGGFPTPPAGGGTVGGGSTTFIPGFPNAGYAPDEESGAGTMSALLALILGGLTLGAYQGRKYFLK